MLLKRKIEIERTIDDHLVDLYTTGNMHHFEGLTLDMKLEYLMGQSAHLEQNSDKMRMKGLTLSYDVFQSNQFKSLNTIHEIVTNKQHDKYKLSDEQEYK